MNLKLFAWRILIFFLLSGGGRAEQAPFVMDVATICAQKEACYAALQSKGILLAIDVHEMIVQWEAQKVGVSSNPGDPAPLEALIQVQLASCHIKYQELLREQQRQLEITPKERETVAQGPSFLSSVSNFLKDSFANNWYSSDASKKDVIAQSIVAGAWAVPAVQQSLTRGEVEEIAQSVAEKDAPLADPYMHAFSVSKRVYQALVQKIVTKNIQENGFLPSPREVAEITRDFDRCLTAALLPPHLDRCVDKFLAVAPISVGKFLLAKNVQQHLASRHPPNFTSEQWLSLLTQETEKFYLNCVISWYEAAEEKNAATIKPCVYEAMMAGMASTANYQMDFHLRPLVGSGIELETIKRQIFSQSKCDLLPHLEKLGKFVPGDYRSLATWDSQRFTRDLRACGEAIERHSAPVVIRYKVEADPAVNKAFASKDQLQLMIEQLGKELLMSCLDIQKKAGKKFDTAECRPLINAKVVAEVVSKNLASAITEQQTKLNTDFSQLEKNILELHSQCEEEVQKDLLALVASTPTSLAMNKSPTNHLECAALAIGKMAAELVVPILERELRGREELKGYTVNFSPEEVLALQETIATCYRRGITQLGDISELSAKMGPLGELCGQSANKAVLPKILRIVLDHKLQEFLPSADERLPLVAKIMDGDNGWENKISKIASKQELKKVIERFQQDATWQSFNFLVGKNLEELFPLKGELAQVNADFRRRLVQQHLTPRAQQRFLAAATDSKSMALELTTQQNAITMMMVTEIIQRELVKNITDSSKRKLLADYLLGKMNLCLKSNAVAFCQQYITVESYYQIGGMVLADNIVLTTIDEKKKLTSEIYRQLSECFATGKSLSTLGEQKNHYESCLATQSLWLAHHLGDHAVGYFSEAMGGPRAMADTQKTFQGCLEKIKRPKLNNAGLEMIKAGLKKCGQQLEGEIKQSIRNNFLAQERPGQLPDHRKILARVLDSFFSLSSIAANRKQADQVPLGPQLTQLANNVILACNYDRSRCLDGVNALERDFASLIKNQSATGARRPNSQGQIDAAFFQGPLMDVMIEASLSSILLEQFFQGLGVDRQGPVARKLATLFSSINFSQHFQTPAGKALKVRLLQTLQEGGAGQEQLSKDPVIRRQLAEMLTSKKGVGGFGEQLLGVIVAEKLVQMQQNPSFTLKFGNFLGIIDFRHFRWDLIVTTEEGQAAINYFQREILVPKMVGENLSTKEWQQREEMLEKFISRALRSLKAQELAVSTDSAAGFGDQR